MEKSLKNDIEIIQNNGLMNSRELSYVARRCISFVKNSFASLFHEAEAQSRLMLEMKNDFANETPSNHNFGFPSH